MSKTTKFFKSLFGFKPSEPPSDVDKQPKRRWSFFKSRKGKPHHNHHFSDTSLSHPRDTPRHHHYSNHISCSGNGSANNHAVVVAAATAAVAEAAVAAAHAAVEVVRMTSRINGADVDYHWAALKIQSYFRAYLARKALRALKGLVKLQALVRGHIQRKKAADDLRRFQALVRAQARALASRFQIADSPQSITKGCPTPEKFEHVVRSRITKHNQPSMLKNNGWKPYDERNEKILEIDATKSNIKRRNLFQPDQISYSHSQSLTTSRGSTIQPPALSPSGSYEVNSQTTPLKYSTHDLEEEVSLYTTQNSPLLYTKGNGSMRVSPFTPAKSDSSRSCLSGYSDHPNYMAYTESSRAKVRSLSAPRQRPNIEVPSTTKRYSVYGCGPAAQHGGSILRDSFVSKAYPGSGRLDRLGMPVGGVGFS